jgi:hypothetical protein
MLVTHAGAMAPGASRAADEGLVPAEAARRNDRLKLAEIQFANRAQGFRGCGVLETRRQTIQPGSVFGLSVTSSATASFQRRTRLRWSAARRVRITGLPDVRAAR